MSLPLLQTAVLIASLKSFGIGRGTRENRFIGKLSSSTPLVPPAAHNKELAAFRKSLPIAGMREDILNAIDRNQVRIC